MTKKPRLRLDHSASIELQPADPFELIRWLARSQPDPRKAVAELVQNSLDAAAEHIVIERSRVKGNITLRIIDDGEGVLPDMEREAALRHLASHIGHSHKLSLDPGERARRVVAGQYGVGLLGFWAIGHRMEIRSRVDGSDVAVLRMVEDSPHAEVGSQKPSAEAADTFTEVVISEVHATSRRVLSAKRLSAYLATELRGQLVRSGAKLEVDDRLSRGQNRRLEVVPHRFSGQALSLPAEVAVPGFRPAKVELYLARGIEGATIELSCAGTRVADDISKLDALGLSEPPWTGAEVTGVVDFPDFDVPPGTRRGVLPNAAALAFLEAMSRLAPRVLSELVRLDSLHRAELDQVVVKELRRALRGFDERVRDLSLPVVSTDQPGRSANDGGEPGGSGLALGDSRQGEGSEETEDDETEAGALCSVHIVPAFARLSPGATRRVRAVAKDADGRKLDGVTLEWRLPGPTPEGLSLTPEGERALLGASPDVPLGVQAPLMVVATADDETVADIAAVEIVEAKHEVYSRLGIPEPVLVSAPGAPWRSRRRGFAWEINDAHPDYVRVRDSSRRRLRYLIALLAKEIVIGSTQREDAGELLEAMVQVIAHAEGNLR